ncbi:hypothetical protein KAFR_0B03960 [Kazachstania africana CBS 2517]|uniref:N-acetylglucosaminylphosphatidylinositol deacetylase n=1 Tax=Kazachstania africana (strain ATCC 22294 / BCRC 22015 / CBS 2517 / CECT 1963 / NBRC 1671 / NRRL Y-8276) TaxID=1071382 RepID=H2AQP2_KAZAF|nr:hypothetical protein KAFR_0B03960 [Kazachstania africana CBS 2517]CCF56692.1 hypothetical protein KAFR_0B03960 [Kazachstania africana CBS 2517]
MIHISKLIFKITKLTLIFWCLYIVLSPKIQLSNDQILNTFIPSLIKDRSNDPSLTLVVAHPDDEVMFFSPTLLQLDSHLPPNCKFNIISYSDGDAEGLGSLRSNELAHSIDMLIPRRNKEIFIFNHTDGMNEVWDNKLMLHQLESILSDSQTNILLTFDQFGVSNHINHKACHQVVTSYIQSHAKNNFALLLDSYSSNLLKKYTGFAWQLVFLAKNYWIHGKTLPNLDHLALFNPYSDYITAYATMLKAHKSQMVWFRYGWWFFSRFVYVNDLKLYTH